jgi:hypothetical protein
MPVPPHIRPSKDKDAGAESASSSRGSHRTRALGKPPAGPNFAAALACRESPGANAENAPLTLVLLDWNQAGERGIPKKFVQMQKTC